jgi:tight adherence protein C
MGPLGISLVVFLVLSLGGVALYVAASGQRYRVQARLDQVSEKKRRGIAPSDLVSGSGDQQAAQAMLKWAVGRLPKPDTKSRKGAKLGETLAQAGFKGSYSVALFQLAKVGSTAAGVLIGIAAAAAIHSPPARVVLLAIAGASAGSFIPGNYIGRRAKNRQIDIARQLSDVLDLLVVCVEAGLGLLESIKTVGRETESENLVIGHELSAVAGEVSAGSTLGDALRSLAERSGVEDIKPLAATLIQSEQLGAAIGPALRAISDSMRSRRRLRAEESAQKTTIKILFPLVLMILPAMLMIIIGPAIVQTVRTLSF